MPDEDDGKKINIVGDLQSDKNKRSGSNFKDIEGLNKIPEQFVDFYM